MDIERKPKRRVQWVTHWSTELKIVATRAGTRPGPFPSTHGAGFGREAAQNRRLPVPPKQNKTKQQKPKNNFDCLLL